jgi:hypothetical protein
MPTRSRAATSTTITAAGRLKTPGTMVPSRARAVVPGAVVSAGGSASPRSRRKLTKYPDQPTAMVEALRAYSSTRSQPMIQATNSPAEA